MTTFVIIFGISDSSNMRKSTIQPCKRISTEKCLIRLTGQKFMNRSKLFTHYYGVCVW